MNILITFLFSIVLGILGFSGALTAGAEFAQLGFVIFVDLFLLQVFLHAPGSTEFDPHHAGHALPV